jgi:hypothetical protein
MARAAERRVPTPRVLLNWGPMLATSLFLEPVPPPRGPGLPRAIRFGERVLRRAY